MWADAMRTSLRKQIDASITSNMAVMNIGTTTSVRLMRLITLKNMTATTAEISRVAAVSSSIARIVSYMRLR